MGQEQRLRSKWIWMKAEIAMVRMKVSRLVHKVDGAEDGAEKLERVSEPKWAVVWLEERIWESVIPS